MPLLGFKKQFVPLVKSGEKKQTIRARRKDGRDPRKGQTLFMYEGLRTSSCEKIGETECTDSLSIIIYLHVVTVAGRMLEDEEIEEVARADGFKSVDDFRKYFLPGWPHCDPDAEFDGYLIKWDEIPK